MAKNERATVQLAARLQREQDDTYRSRDHISQHPTPSVAWYVIGYHYVGWYCRVKLILVSFRNILKYSISFYSSEKVECIDIKNESEDREVH
jgi:hypothetical protein